MSKNLKPKVILFDFYGTLLDIKTDEYDPAVWEKIALFLKYHGLAADGDLLMQSFTHSVKSHLEQSEEKYPEISVSGIFRKMILDLGYSGPEDLLITTTRLFRSLSIQQFEIFPDTIPTLKELARHYRLGLVTDAQRVFFDPEIQMTGLKPYFDAVIVSSDYLFHKPDPRMFTMALEKLKVPPSQALFVGDSWTRDVQGAQSIGIRGILLNRNSHPYDFEGHTAPHNMIDSLDDLHQSGLAF
jgi:putative hydrolase of the HAD superfamily